MDSFSYGNAHYTTQHGRIEHFGLWVTLTISCISNQFRMKTSKINAFVLARKLLANRSGMLVSTSDPKAKYFRLTTDLLANLKFSHEPHKHTLYTHDT